MTMKIASPFVVVFFIATISIFAVDELALRLEPALEAITPDGMFAHIKVLASDEFEGRAPGSKGEELSVKYITDQFKQIGLKPVIRMGRTHRKFRWPESRANPECRSSLVIKPSI
jgi:hypothetical protein